jgi:hypothetical protein
MAVSGAIIDYSGAAGQRNNTVFIQLTFSGSFTTGGDPLNLATLSNPNGLDVEGFFELPLTLAPAVYLEDIGGYYVQPKLVGSTLNAFLINVYAPGGGIVSGAYNGGGLWRIGRLWRTLFSALFRLQKSQDEAHGFSRSVPQSLP